MKSYQGNVHIEVVVLLLVVVFGLMLFFPMATVGRNDAKAAACMSHLGILQRAWLRYQDDYDGRLVGGSNYYSGSRGTPYRWVERPLYEVGNNPEYNPVPGNNEITQEYRLNGIKSGRLYPYAEDASLYHCPSDRTWVEQEHPYQPYRSYAISGTMNAEDFIYRNGLYGPITIYRTVTFPDGPKRILCAERMDQIINPSQKFVFAEEEIVLTSVHGAQPFNAGSFILMGSNSYWDWWDVPAAWHRNGSVLSFVDGHVELPRWRDERTLGLIKGTNSTRIQPDNPDLMWLILGYLVDE
ncbi:MAG: hypothetical protein JXA82_09130 [Sedimentisphaerales bacterium]|nr:hypothetical protein [Sedimentisphaerales bacterium]